MDGHRLGTLTIHRTNERSKTNPREFPQGDAGAADSWFLRALSISPNSTEALHHYAQHLVETRRFEAAVEIYRKALTISPDDFEVTFNLANCYRQLRHHKDAEKFYRRAVEIKPEVSESTIPGGRFFIFAATIFFKMQP